ncbi:hypothetical protein [Demequina zhanjiangensis]|uniref:Uncharacterized protein n=1 Tax=Demequina zhanjiangensis TaxID=3051659 RepID=A0ABT8G069_9MICO|nr:hypothetical protein [Demequina sp. SYSU T00b26]MDN4472114.1 hypothetical protein [Demequina sp. SYSU T00b26]
MSFDIYVQGFGDDPVDMAATIGPILAPLLSVDGLSISTGDGSADVYGARKSPMNGLMFNHVAGKRAWEVIFEVAKAADWVVIPVGGPVCLVGEHQLAALPAELRDVPVEVVHSGQELLGAVSEA